MGGRFLKIGIYIIFNTSTLKHSDEQSCFKKKHFQFSFIHSCKFSRTPPPPPYFPLGAVSPMGFKNCANEWVLFCEKLLPIPPPPQLGLFQKNVTLFEEKNGREGKGEEFWRLGNGAGN